MEKMLKYPVVVRELEEEDGGGFLAEIPDLPGCVSDGESVEEAISSVNDAALEWIATARTLGRAIPEPASLDHFSGRWVQRVPRSLHKKLVFEAKREGVSLNALVTALLAERLTRRGGKRSKAA